MEPISEGRRNCDELRQSALKQNSFSAWRPRNTPQKNFALFLCFGLGFLAAGVAFFVLSARVWSLALPYSGDTAEILLAFSPSETVDPPVSLYYVVEGLYQNHRRFASSKSMAQLSKGKYEDKKSAVTTCYPVFTESDRLGTRLLIFITSSRRREEQPHHHESMRPRPQIHV